MLLLLFGESLELEQMDVHHSEIRCLMRRRIQNGLKSYCLKRLGRKVMEFVNRILLLLFGESLKLEQMDVYHSEIRWLKSYCLKRLGRKVTELVTGGITGAHLFETKYKVLH
ncbi:hypothetical protein AVEN_55206-1 [Araneus ventricosus]|uniref:Uncharacterized protein n=1 Tax=Araneus ventricosus TaxID=182803 RepID=A0A4Y2G8G3_ARAVE|nr:hypothetical protein AVEN_55206-1 [Araneus ventricosus]